MMDKQKLNKIIDETKDLPVTPIRQIGNFFKGVYVLSPLCKLINREKYEVSHYILKRLAETNPC